MGKRRPTDSSTCIVTLPTAHNDATIVEESDDSSSVNHDSVLCCRICLDGKVRGYNLISPCQCTGSALYAHDRCLLKWYLATGKKICDICLTEINIHANGTRPIHKWKLPKQSSNIVASLFLTYTILLLVFLVLIGWVAAQRCLSIVCISFYVISLLSLSYFIYCCGCGRYMKKYRRSFLMANKAWRVDERNKGPVAVPATAAAAKTHRGSQSSECFIVSSSPTIFDNHGYRTEQPISDRLVRKTSAYSMDISEIKSEHYNKTNISLIEYKKTLPVIVPTPDYNETRKEII